MSKKMAVGDVNCNDRGSGARDNSGKPDWSLMVFQHLIPIISILESSNYIPLEKKHLTGAMATFQLNPTKVSAEQLLTTAVRYGTLNNQSQSVIDLLEEVVLVWEAGKQKYAAWNWLKGMPWSVPFASMARHFIWDCKGMYKDNETGRSHRAHIVCNAMMLYHYVCYYPEGNDLPSPEYFVSHSEEES